MSPRTAPGAPPGTLAADPTAPPPVVSVIAYDGEELLEETVENLEAIPGLREKWSRVWVNVDGLGDAETIRAIGELFGLHALALEDVANANQRPKLEEYSDHLFIIARMPQLDRDTFRTEQLSLFCGEGFVVTFQERPGDCFEPVRKRLRGGRHPI